MPVLIVLIVLVAIIAIYVVSTYNQLVTLKTRILASIQEIGNQLKRQADLIPNLEESAKAYLKHEKDIFQALTDARKAVTQAVASNDVAQMSQASSLLGKAIDGLRVVVESNPEIKGNEVITKLMDELRDTADKVMYARRTLIDLTADYNVLIVAFPGNLVANMFGFKPEKGLEMPADVTPVTSVTTEDLKTPKVKLE